MNGKVCGGDSDLGCGVWKSLNEFSFIEDDGKGTGITRYHTLCLDCDKKQRRINYWGVKWLGYPDRKHPDWVSQSFADRRAQLSDFRTYLRTHYEYDIDLFSAEFKAGRAQKGNPTQFQVNCPVDAKVRKVVKTIADSEREETGVKGSHAEHVVGYIYAVTLETRPGYVKIGKAVNPDARLASFQVNDPEDGYTMNYAFAVYHYADAERELKRRLRPYHHKGEWYKVELDTVLDQLVAIYITEPYRIPELMKIEEAA